ncbi:hypothetical protein [Actinoallomurus iriomotensis]|uniref:PH domain-containing protein n=1 Tax=Actinoallomurus iriomotensis TaxID=478107 RepID=A0A9W6RWG7_9ACTN|nr:hypothetical protein [Actinoallomurus iriomotensis]GLY82953.1 hypothetical protein Airi02_008830 [Actinoallomurus iriomotensis]
MLTVGYRWAAVAKAGLPAVLLPLAAGYAEYIARGDGPLISVLLLVVFGFVTVVFLPLFLRAVVRASRGAPLLTIGEDGVTLHSARVRLPWSNVAEVRVERRPGRAELLVFVPVDAAQVVTAHRGTPRWFARGGIPRVGGPIFVRADQLARPLEEVLAAVRRWTSAPVRRREILRNGPAGR